MAASGIAEHNEARRRERVYLRQAYLNKLKANKGIADRAAQNQAGLLPSQTVRDKDIDSYKREMEYRERMGMVAGSDPKMVDQCRRLAHYKQMQAEYSAKLPQRYTSIDYMSQW